MLCLMRMGFCKLGAGWAGLGVLHLITYACGAVRRVWVHEREFALPLPGAPVLSFLDQDMNLFAPSLALAYLSRG